jgi:hypothetical protein
MVIGCPICNKEVEEKEVVQHPDYKEIVLTCGHKHRRVERDIMQNVNVSDQVTAQVISFDNDEDMDNAFYELIHNSDSGFSGVGEKEIIVTNKQCELLKRKNIHYTNKSNKQ